MIIHSLKICSKFHGMKDKYGFNICIFFLHVEGNTPLYEASYYCHKECVELLLQAGAEVNKTNSKGNIKFYQHYRKS